MVRATAVFVACVAWVAFAGAGRADDIAWTDADKAELAKLAKGAKKNGASFTVSNDIIEARMPTRESAAEFFLYYDRLAKAVRPLWGTREYAMKPITIALHDSDAPWPDSKKKVRHASQSAQRNEATNAPPQVASLNVWLHPSLADEPRPMSAAPADELNSAGLNLLLMRLCGTQKQPQWLGFGMLSVFQKWSPIPNSTKERPFTKSFMAAMTAGRLPNDAVEDLMPWFESAKLPPAKAGSNDQMMAFMSFFEFMLEHKRGRDALTQVCECITRGKPIEFDEKVVGKLVPHWHAWAGVPPVPAK